MPGSPGGGSRNQGSNPGSPQRPPSNLGSPQRRSSAPATTVRKPQSPGGRGPPRESPPSSPSKTQRPRDSGRERDAGDTRRLRDSGRERELAASDTRRPRDSGRERGADETRRQGSTRDSGKRGAAEAPRKAFAPPPREQAQRPKVDQTLRPDDVERAERRASGQGSGRASGQGSGRASAQGGSRAPSAASSSSPQKKAVQKPCPTKMPAAGEMGLRWLDTPKKPVGPKHYEHYCAGVYDFMPEPPKKEDEEVANAKAYSKGAMTEEQYNEIQEHMGTVLATKFKTCRRAFRMYDEDCSGTIGRSEVRKLFGYQGYSSHAADRFFNKMDSDRNGTIEFENFVEVFAPYIQPVDDLPDYKGIVSSTHLYHNSTTLQENKGE